MKSFLASKLMRVTAQRFSTAQFADQGLWLMDQNRQALWADVCRSIAVLNGEQWHLLD
jgi:hypothetical protein